MADKKKPEEKTKKKSGGKLRLYTFMALFIAMAPFMIPTIALAIVGLLPTLIALFTDRDPQYSGAIAVGSMNFAGVSPFIIDLLLHGQSMSYVINLLSEPFNWMVMYGAAGIGHLTVYAIPPMFTSFTVLSYQARIKTLKENMEKLQDSWGKDVGTAKPIDQINQ